MPPEDKVPGVEQPNGTWTGIIGQLTRKVRDCVLVGIPLLWLTNIWSYLDINRLLFVSLL